MDSKKTQKYKKKLEKERARLLEELEKVQKHEDFGSDIDHFDEEADEAESLSNQLAIVQELKNQLEEIDVSLGKIGEGKYGICEKCKGEIETKILNIVPESRFCKSCKKREIKK